MKEKEFRDHVVELARTLGWSVNWFPKVPVKYPGQALRWTTPVMGDGKGWLDLFMLRERPLAVELKATETGGVHVTPEQQEWLSRWHTAGVDAFVWTPRMLGEGGQIETELKRRERYRPPIVLAS